MKLHRFFCAALTGLLLVVAGCSRPPTVLDETAKFEGDWTLVELNEKGKQTDAKKLARYQVTFNNAQYMRIEMGDIKVASAESYSVRTDAAKKPAEIDFVSLQGDDQGKTRPGIYEFANDKLTIAIASALGGARPAALSGDAKTTFMVLERKK